MTIKSQEPPDDDVISAQRVKDTYPDKDQRKLSMAVIDGRVYHKGPDGLWYRLEGNDE